MKTVTSIGSNFISVAILPTTSSHIASAIADPVAFTLHTVSHSEIADVLERLITMRNSRSDYSTEVTIDVRDPLYGNIKFHKYDHAYVAVVANHCKTKFFGDLNLLKPAVKQIRKWTEQNAALDQ